MTWRASVSYVVDDVTSIGQYVVDDVASTGALYVVEYAASIGVHHISGE